MKKVFGVLLAVLFVFCVAGSANATRCDWDGKKGGKCIKEFKVIDWQKILNDVCGKIKKAKKKGPKKLGICGPIPRILKDCKNIDLRFCEWRPPCDTNPVPEPATMLLFGAGLAGLGMLRKKFKQV